MNAELLKILVCPEDRTRLSLADGALVERLNRAVAAQQLKNRAGRLVDKPLDAALVRADGKVAYPVIDNIPRMLADESITLEEISTP